MRRALSMSMPVSMLVVVAACGSLPPPPPAPPAHPSLLRRLACSPVRVLSTQPRMLELGGTRGAGMDGGWFFTLDDGDGVLLSEDDQAREYLSWWSHGACRWRAPIARFPTMWPAHDRVWLRTFFDQNGTRPDVWSEIDADARVRRTLLVPHDQYLEGLEATANGLIALTWQYGKKPVLWRIGGEWARLAELPLDAHLWSFATALGDDGAIGVVAATSDQPGYANLHFDPRLIVVDPSGKPRLDVTIATGPFDGALVAALPGGDWLAALGPIPSGGAPMAVVRVAADGRVVWRQDVPDLEPVALRADGTLDALAPHARDSIQRTFHQLRFDLATGAIMLDGPLAGRRWIAQPVFQIGTLVDGVAVPLETWLAEQRPSCGPGGFECREGYFYHAIAGALVVLPPTEP